MTKDPEKNFAPREIFQLTAAEELAHKLKELRENSPEIAFADLQQIVSDFSFSLTVEEDERGNWYLAFRYPYDEKLEDSPKKIDISVAGVSREQLENSALQRIQRYL